MGTHHILKDGTSYAIKGGTDLIAGTSYQIGGGRTLVDGTGYKIGFAEPVYHQVTVTGRQIYFQGAVYNGKTYLPESSFEVLDGETVYVSGSKPDSSIFYDNEGVANYNPRTGKVEYTFAPKGDTEIFNPGSGYIYITTLNS